MWLPYFYIRKYRRYDTRSFFKVCEFMTMHHYLPSHITVLSGTESYDILFLLLLVNSFHFLILLRTVSVEGSYYFYGYYKMVIFYFSFYRFSVLLTMLPPLLVLVNFRHLKKLAVFRYVLFSN